MTRQIRHSFFIDAPMDAILAALVTEEHIRKWWTKEARVVDGKGTFGWSGHGWSVDLDMDHDIAARRVVWRCTRSNRAYFVGTSLKQYVETGKGIPYPEMQDTSAPSDRA